MAGLVVSVRLSGKSPKCFYTALKQGRLKTTPRFCPYKPEHGRMISIRPAGKDQTSTDFDHVAKIILSRFGDASA
jgi:hypothetical protein